MTEEVKRCALNLFWNVVLQVGVYSMILAASYEYDNTSSDRACYVLEANFLTVNSRCHTTGYSCFKSILRHINQPFAHPSIYTIRCTQQTDPT